jgi:outer membrane protein
MNRLLTPSAVLVVLAAAPALAEEPAGPPIPLDLRERPGFGVGMAVSVSDEPYRGVGTELQPMPILRYRGKRFAAFGPFMSYQLSPLDRPLALKAVLGPAFDGYDASDSDFLDGMDDRDMTAEGGLELELDTDVAEVALTWKHDLLSQHDGYSVELSLRKPTPIGRVFVAPSISYVYDSDDRSDYYFGVRPQEATADRPAYELDGTHNWRAGVVASTNLTRKVFAIAGANYTIFDDDISDSPIVSQDGQYRVFLGLGYMFGGGKPSEPPDARQAGLDR